MQLTSTAAARPRASRKPPTWWRGAIVGLLTVVAALGVAELVAGVVPGTTSPIVAVGGQVIDAVPRPVKDFAIDVFGTRDKLALLAGISVVLAALGASIGVVSLRRFPYALAGVALFGILGFAASVTRPGAGVLAGLPSLVGAVAGVGALGYLVRAVMGTSPLPLPFLEDSTPATFDRRRFLAVAGAVAAVAVVSAGVGRVLGRRFSVASTRASLDLPPAGEPLADIAAEVEVGAEGVTAFVTPNADFYRIDTALSVPQVALDSWTLRVHGMVDRELTFTFDELLERTLIEADVTLTCVSNEIGGGLIGNARWLGVHLGDLLDEAGVQDGADQVVGRSVDGMTNGFPVTALDGRTALVAVGMNGEPLPAEHGYPARLVVAGLYGYVSATKWLTEIELTTFDAFDQYWVEREWDEHAPIKVQSRIDVPRGLSRIPPGPTAVAGVAWAQTRGIQRVEVQVDDGEWREARLGDELTAETWRQWVFEWDATPGSHNVRARATDGAGDTQGETRVTPFPNGAEGWHSVVVIVEDAA